MIGKTDILKEIEKYRTLDELKEYIDWVYSKTELDVNLIRLNRLKYKRYKEFWEELVPLFIYASHMDSGKGELYKIKIGNQAYDAIRKIGKESNKIEFTEYQDGHKEHKFMEQLNLRGYTEIEIGTPSVEKNNFLDGFFNLGRKKAAKNYDGMEIVFIVSYSKLNFLLEGDIQSFLNELLEPLRSIDFGNNVIYLMFKKGKYDDLTSNRLIKI